MRTELRDFTVESYPDAWSNPRTETFDFDENRDYAYIKRVARRMDCASLRDEEDCRQGS